MPVFTIGRERDYDKGLAVMGPKFTKCGQMKGYRGGYAVRTIEDAKRLLERFGGPEWAVYELDARWSDDAVERSLRGWWNSLINDARIIRKVENNL